MSFIEEFRKMRVRIGTQEDVSDLLKISVSSVSQIEREFRVPPEHKQREFLNVLGEKVLELSQAELMRKRRLNGII